MLAKYLFALLLLLQISLSGCQTNPTTPKTAGEENTTDKELWNGQCADPLVYAVGNTVELTYDEDNPQSIKITIEGQGLENKCAYLWVQLGGTRNALYGHDYEVDYSDEHSSKLGGLPYVTIREQFFLKAKTGDRLRLYIRAQTKRPYSEQEHKGKPVEPRHSQHIFERSFTLFTTDDYRNLIQARHIGPEEFSASPASYEETTNLFGQWVADHYFAIRLSMSNSDDRDKLISISRIKAHGRVLVRYNNNKNDEKYPWFTIPIDIGPQPATHMYAVLEDEEPKSTRARWFRFFQLAGTIGSLYGSVYASTPNPTEAWGLWSSEIVPAIGDLWPNPWPAFKANIVNKTMPDLVRIPKGSSNDNAGQYIFFSKDRIEGLLSDQALFANPGFNVSNLAPSLQPPNSTTSPKPPQMNVLSIDFESLLIPFELTASPTVLNSEQKSAQLNLDLAKTLRSLEEFSANPKTLGIINLETLSIINTDITISKVMTSLTAHRLSEPLSDEKAGMDDLIGQYKQRMKQLKEFKSYLANHPVLGKDSFKVIETEMELLNSIKLSGLNLSGHEGSIKSYSEKVDLFRQSVHFYSLLVISVKEIIELATNKDGELRTIDDKLYIKMKKILENQLPVFSQNQLDLLEGNPALADASTIVNQE